MKPYSQDLRDRIIKALEAGTETQRVIVERFCVSRPFVEKLWHRWRRSGSSAAKPHADHLELLRTEAVSAGARSRGAGAKRAFVLPTKSQTSV